jgi:hypothetical protein
MGVSRVYHGAEVVVVASEPIAWSESQQRLAAISAEAMDAALADLAARGWEGMTRDDLTEILRALDREPRRERA